MILEPVDPPRNHPWMGPWDTTRYQPLVRSQRSRPPVSRYAPGTQTHQRRRAFERGKNLGSRLSNLGRPGHQGHPAHPHVTSPIRLLTRARTHSSYRPDRLLLCMHIHTVRTVSCQPFARAYAEPSRCDPGTIHRSGHPGPRDKQASVVLARVLVLVSSWSRDEIAVVVVAVVVADSHRPSPLPDCPRPHPM